MEILHDKSLTNYSTMRLGGQVAHITKISSREELVEAVDWAENENLSVMMMGRGSNIVWRDEGYAGLLLVNEIKGFEIEANGDYHYLNIGAGENWDSVVERSVSANLTGIEALSLIPGTAGATPVQNVGAYGQELSQTLVTIEAYDTRNKDFVTIANQECGFSYRDSRFKSGPDRGRFFILSIKLRLKQANPTPPFYSSVQKYFDEHNIVSPTPSDLRQAVVTIRKAKLPDPAVINNCGSFFGNPVVEKSVFEKLSKEYSNIPSWATKDGQVKISAAWLIETAGFKGFRDETTGMATWKTQPLVLVNESARSSEDLEKFKAKIVNAIQQKFGIILVQEPELLP